MHAILSTTKFLIFITTKAQTNKQLFSSVIDPKIIVRSKGMLDLSTVNHCRKTHINYIVYSLTQEL